MFRVLFFPTQTEIFPCKQTFPENPIRFIDHFGYFGYTSMNLFLFGSAGVFSGLVQPISISCRHNGKTFRFGSVQVSLSVCRLLKRCLFQFFREVTLCQVNQMIKKFLLLGGPEYGKKFDLDEKTEKLDVICNYINDLHKTLEKYMIYGCVSTIKPSLNTYVKVTIWDLNGPFEVFALDTLTYNEILKCLTEVKNASSNVSN